MCSRITSLIPFWQPFASYSLKAHKAAFKKFFILWFFSVLPLFVSALAQFVSEGDKLWDLFASGIWNAFNGTHQFIYTVSFITPIFYLAWERLKDHEEHSRSGEALINEIKFTPPGLGWILIWSIFVFTCTVVAYAFATSTHSENDQRLIQKLLTENTAIYVYVFSLICWYFTILDSFGPPGDNFSKETKRGESKQIIDLRNRIEKRRLDK